MRRMRAGPSTVSPGSILMRRPAYHTRETTPGPAGRPSSNTTVVCSKYTSGAATAGVAAMRARSARWVMIEAWTAGRGWTAARGYHTLSLVSCPRNGSCDDECRRRRYPPGLASAPGGEPSGRRETPRPLREPAQGRRVRLLRHPLHPHSPELLGDGGRAPLAPHPSSPREPAQGDPSRRRAAGGPPRLLRQRVPRAQEPEGDRDRDLREHGALGGDGRPHRPLQPRLLPERAAARDAAQQAPRPQALAGHARPRRLQAPERHARPPRRRRGAHEGGLPDDAEPARGGHRGPLRGRGVRP